MSEKWEAIKGYKGLYEISNKGRVKSLCKRVGGNGAMSEKVNEYPIQISESDALETILQELIKQGIYDTSSVPGREKSVKYFSPNGRVEFFPKVGFQDD